MLRFFFNPKDDTIEPDNLKLTDETKRLRCQMKGGAGGGGGSVLAHVALQEVEHALLCNLFALVKLLQCLFDLVVLNLALTLLLVVKVQAAALHLLQVMLQRK